MDVSAYGTIGVRIFMEVKQSFLTDTVNRFVDIKEGDAEGIYCIYNKDIFEAVYSTNLLMPVTDLLVTKPSELAYYPIPKLFMRHIGGHEVYGAVNGQENGDSTPECPTKKEANEMLDRVISDKELIPHMCDRIDELKKHTDNIVINTSCSLLHVPFVGLLTIRSRWFTLMMWLRP